MEQNNNKIKKRPFSFKAVVYGLLGYLLSCLIAFYGGIEHTISSALPLNAFFYLSIIILFTAGGAYFGYWCNKNFSDDSLKDNAFTKTVKIIILAILIILAVLASMAPGILLFWIFLSDFLSPILLKMPPG